MGPAESHIGVNRPAQAESHPGVNKPAPAKSPWWVNRPAPAETHIKAKGSTGCSDTLVVNCIHTHCCNDLGMQCFQKDFFWAACKDNCTKGIDPLDPVPLPWSCRPLGTRT